MFCLMKDIFKVELITIALQLVLHYVVQDQCHDVPCPPSPQSGRTSRRCIR